MNIKLETLETQEIAKILVGLEKFEENRKTFEDLVTKIFGEVTTLENQMNELLPHLALELAKRVVQHDKKSNFDVGAIIKIQKISDDVFEGKHPNGIYEGYTKIDTIIQKPEVGFALICNGLHTSDITKIIYETENEMMFKTRNSTYKITLKENWQK